MQKFLPYYITGAMNVSSKVPSSFDGTSLPEYLAARFRYLPAAAWLQLIRDERIRCRDIVCDETMVVARGDRICCDLPDFEPPAVNLDYEITHLDEWLLGINKPAGLRVHSRGKFVNANLIYHLRHVRQPPYPEVDLAHRLDADTSGLVLLARDKAVLAHLIRQFRDNSIEKRYLSVVEGCPTPTDGSINLPIGQVKAASVPRYGIDHGEGKTALTHYKTLRNLSANYSLLELHPETGRTHQLRVHLAAIGHPIAGDALYTMNDSDYLDYRRNPTPRTGLQRQALHSHQLRFIHPILQTPCTLSAPLAPDIEQFIQEVTETDSGLE
jgi:23S rRNA pseudouridine1911/1915/1917 synthase